MASRYSVGVSFVGEVTDSHVLRVRLVFVSFRAVACVEANLHKSTKIIVTLLQLEKTNAFLGLQKLGHLLVQYWCRLRLQRASSSQDGRS